MSKLDELRKKIEEVDRLLKRSILTDVDIQLAEQQSTFREMARVSALYSIVRELCLHEGISHEQFIEHLHLRTAHFHELYLRTVSDTDKNLSGRLDNRSTDEVATNDEIPPLFPSDSDQ